MAQEPPIESLIPQPPIPDGASDFSLRVHKLLDGKPKDEAMVAQALAGQDEIFDLIAAGLYSLASMLAGEGEDSVRLIEEAVANTEVSACCDPQEARRNSRRALCSGALELLVRRNAASLAAPQGPAPASTCIEDDDLASAGITSEELERMIAGPDRERVRTWLESLPTELRTVFVLRAVAGISTPETAAMLKNHGGPEAAGWTPEGVREVFRQGLCSLASQLIHASAGNRA